MSSNNLDPTRLRRAQARATRRFFLADRLAGATSGVEIAIEGQTAHRIRHVLRLQPGEHVILVGSGRAFEGRLEDTDGRVRIRLERELSAGQMQPPLTLYQGLIRLNRFEWLIEKGTELGVTAFVPMLTERTTVRATEIGAARLARWRRIAAQALEQSRGYAPPEIRSPLSFSQALAEAGKGCVLAWEGLGETPPLATLGELRDRAESGLSLFVGPEGGFSEAEIEQARSAGATLIGLGPRTLRAETAAIVGSALLLLGPGGGQKWDGRP